MSSNNNKGQGHWLSGTPKSTNRNANNSKKPNSTNRYISGTPNSTNRNANNSKKPNSTNRNANNKTPNSTNRNAIKQLPTTIGEFLNQDFNKLVNNTNNIYTRGLKLIYSKSVYTQIKHFLSNKNTNSRKEIITKQINQIKNNYVSLTDKMKSRNFNKYTNNDRNFEIDFLFLIWLDLTHDGSTKQTFQQFLKSGFKKIFIKHDITLPLGNTPMINNILGLYDKKTGIKQDINGIIYKKGTLSWEKFIKHNLERIFNINEGIGILPTHINVNSIKLNVNNPLLLHIDSQHNIITQLQERSKSGNKRKIVKFNNITNLIDSGVYKSNSFKKEMSPFLTQNSPKSRHYWNFDETNLKIGDLSIKPTLNDTYILNNGNGNREIKAGISASNARGVANTNNNTTLGKFLGDFAQILYLANLSHSNPRIALGTNDAMMSAMYIFIFTRCKIRNPPLLIIDTGENNTLLFYGFNNSNYINLTKKVKNTSVYKIEKPIERNPQTNATQPTGFKRTRNPQSQGTKLSSIPENNNNNNKNNKNTHTKRRLSFRHNKKG